MHRSGSWRESRCWVVHWHIRARVEDSLSVRYPTYFIGAYVHCYLCTCIQLSVFCLSVHHFIHLSQTACPVRRFQVSTYSYTISQRSQIGPNPFQLCVSPYCILGLDLVTVTFPPQSVLVQLPNLEASPPLNSVFWHVNEAAPYFDGGLSP